MDDNGIWKIAMNSDKSLTARFIQLTHDLTVNIAGHGTVRQVLKAGDAVELSANPDPGWYFDHWEGDVAATNTQKRVITITVDADKTVTAVFMTTTRQYRWQIASNGKAYSYDTHWNDPFVFPDQFNQDGSGTGFPWAGFGKGVFCIFNPLIDNGELIYWSQVQAWIVNASDFKIGPDGRCDLQGKDVSDALGRPDLVYVQRTASAGAGPILVWQAPLVDRRSGAAAITEGEEFVLIVEKPDQNGNFDNVFDVRADFVDGVWEAGGTDLRGFSVINVTL